MSIRLRLLFLFVSITLLNVKTIALPFRNHHLMYELYVTKSDTNKNPLAIFSPEWGQEKYQDCNTAKAVSYMSEEEKKIIWILNMIRTNPVLFCNSVLLNPHSSFFLYPKKRDYYFTSLIKTLMNINPIVENLQPDRGAYESAYCHAFYSGKKGYVGHRRSNGCKTDFHGECCDYGYADALNIVVDLLIDRDIPDLGHRKIMLSNAFTLMAASIQAHSTYRYNSVLDFK